MSLGLNLGLGVLGRSTKKWYQSTAYLLNNVAPTLIHNYAGNRYYTSSGGVSGFPFTATRTSNATMFNSAGQLVWAPANMIIRSGVSGATVGVIGSGGATPTNWTAISTTGITREIVEVGPNYIDIRWFGTNASGSTVFPHLYLDALTTAVNGARYTLSANVQIVGGSMSGWDSSNGRVELQYFLSGAYNSQATATTSPTTTDTRFSLSTTFPAAGVANQWRPAIRMGLTGSATVDLTLRVHSPQLEYTGADSPKSYNPTNGSAYYGPRLSRDPSTGREGLLVEEARTNVLTYARNYNDAIWTKTDVTFSTTLQDISGVSNAAMLATEGATVTAIIHAGGVVTAGSTLTVSVVLKSTGAVPAQWIRVICCDGAITDGFDGWFDILNGVKGSTAARGAGTSGSSDMVSLGNGWYRCSVKCVPNGTYTTGRICVNSALVNGSGTRVANTTYGMDYAQAETGTGMTSIIPTTGVSATRIKDTVQLSIGSWYNQAQGTIYADFTPFNCTDQTRRIVSVNDGTSNNSISLCYSTVTAAQMRFAVGGVADFTPSTGNTSAVFNRAKAAVRLLSPERRITLNGGTVVATSVSAFPTSGITTLNIMAEGGTGAQLNGYINEVRYYPSADASDAQLQTLTT